MQGGWRDASSSPLSISGTEGRRRSETRPLHPVPAAADWRAGSIVSFAAGLVRPAPREPPECCGRRHHGHCRTDVQTWGGSPSRRSGSRVSTRDAATAQGAPPGIDDFVRRFRAAMDERNADGIAALYGERALCSCRKARSRRAATRSARSMPVTLPRDSEDDAGRDPRRRRCLAGRHPSGSGMSRSPSRAAIPSAVASVRCCT